MAVAMIAKVIIDTPLPHLNHEFDYEIPESLDAIANPGVRVRVKFRNRRVDGFIVDRVQSSNLTKKLLKIEAVVSAEPVLTPQTLQLAKLVAHRTVGNLSDVLSAAIPPRHARAEKNSTDQPSKFFAESDFKPFTNYDNLDVFLNATSKPGLAVIDLAITDQTDLFIQDLFKQGLSHTIVVVPDQFDAKAIIDSLNKFLDPKRVALLTSSQSNESRYREYLKVLRNQSDIVIGTRGAVFAPVKDLKFVLVVDDGDDLLASPQAPYWNVRDVALWRTEIESTRTLVISRAQSIESAAAISTGQAISINNSASNLRAKQILCTHDDWQHGDDPISKSARLPSLVFQAIRDGLQTGAVLISVPRRGYFPFMSCISCKNLFKCGNCDYPLSLIQNDKVLPCRRCGLISTESKCLTCGGNKFRALVTGVERTAEEIGKAFPNAVIKVSTSESRGAIENQRNVIYLATPGVEPKIIFSGVILLDTDLSLNRPDANSKIRYLRHIFQLLSNLNEQGKLIIVGESSNQIIQCAIRLDPAGLAQSLYAERVATKLNPYSRVAKVAGDMVNLKEIKKMLEAHVQIWGPVLTVPSDLNRYQAEMLISVPKSESNELVKSLRAWVIKGSSAKSSPVKVVIDPNDI